MASWEQEDRKRSLERKRRKQEKADNAAFTVKLHEEQERERAEAQKQPWYPLREDPERTWRRWADQAFPRYLAQIDPAQQGRLRSLIIAHVVESLEIDANYARYVRNGGDELDADRQYDQQRYWQRCQLDQALADLGMPRATHGGQHGNSYEFERSSHVRSD